MNNRTIVVPVDGSSYALHAVHYAVTMAKAFGDHIILLNVQPKYDTYKASKLFNNANIQQVQEEEGTTALKEAASILDAEQMSYEKKIRVGIPSIEISSEAKSVDARCIIMGSKGMGPIVSKVLGSVSYGVSHLASCPLTIVPSNE
ncbi:universal stress protein [Bacillus sp. FJAT-45350]|uniref:universal stress protein n=1 Tax=Bacillus sp. FJAT-45350 TaxID=2011014 RepID=UPI000BB68816|nr:universal stress protein [Bacillus sp. FJAT-45350]